MLDKQRKQRLAQWLIILTVFSICFSLSCFLPIYKAPDEVMRYDVSAYILEHHRLPAGSDEEIINELWGFSYAFTPYLPSILAAGIMAIVSVFSSNAVVMVIASRFVNVLAATGCVWLGFKIGEKLFTKDESRFLYSVFIGFLPQIVFLAAYLNNDTFAVFTSMLILLGWLYGKEQHWSYKSCLFLGFAISLCALTYYNAYAWIVCSILYYFGTVIQDKNIENKRKYAIVHGSVIALTVLVLAGWFFIRNAVLYDGDFLGVNAQKACGEIYAVEALKPSNRVTYANEGKTIWNMLMETEWISYSVKSFFACFGALDIWVSAKYYICYGVLMCVAGAGFVYGCLKRKGRSENRLLYICCALCMVIPVILSAYNSYSSDYQAQGRYLMPALPALMLCVAKGYQQIDDILGKRRQYAAIAVCALWLFCFIMIFVKVMMPQLYIGINNI
ncbi:MAG: hypothetical protein K2K21_11565 [Lachnospiraceae bacterium]|nr:hypothetical protein [Lachnospiraceae bacterium]